MCIIIIINLITIYQITKDENKKKCIQK